MEEGALTFIYYRWAGVFGFVCIHTLVYPLIWDYQLHYVVLTCLMY